MRCEIHINHGVSDVVIDTGVCAQCLVRQGSMDLTKSSLSFLDQYIQMKVAALTLSGEAILKNYYTIFEIAIKIYPKPYCLDFLSKLLVELSKSPWIGDKEIEEAYDKARRFEENQ